METLTLPAGGPHLNKPSEMGAPGLDSETWDRTLRRITAGGPGLFAPYKLTSKSAPGPSHLGTGDTTVHNLAGGPHLNKPSEVGAPALDSETWVARCIELHPLGAQ